MKPRPAVALLNATVLAVSSDGRKGLLVKPRKRKRGMRSWELPGGKIDEGESLPAGACREVWEETGIEVQLEAMTALYKCARQDGLMFVFLGRCVEGKLGPRSKEIGSARWEPLETIRAKIKCDLHRQRVEDCLNFSGSPVYRLIRKSPFEIYESWDLGPSSLEGFHFLAGNRNAGVGRETDESRIGIFSSTDSGAEDILREEEVGISVAEVRGGDPSETALHARPPRWRRLLRRFASFPARLQG